MTGIHYSPLRGYADGMSSTAPEKTISPASGRISTGRMWLLCLGSAILLSITVAMAILATAKPPTPHFPNAAICISDAAGREMASAGLQDPQSPHILVPGALTLSMQPLSVKFVDKDKGTKIQIEWRLLRSTVAADSYEFKILTGSNALPTVKRIDVSSQSIELLRGDGVVVTIEEKLFDQMPKTAVGDK